MAHFFLILKSLPWSKCATFYTFTYWRFLGCFQVLAITNKAAVNIAVKENNSQQMVLGLWSFLCFYTAPLPGISCSPQCLPAVLQGQGCLPGIQTSQNIGHRSCSPFCPRGGAGNWEFAPNGTFMPSRRGTRASRVLEHSCPSWICGDWVLQLPKWFLEFSQVFWSYRACWGILKDCVSRGSI
jgi:hypothetical protein